MTRQKKRNLSRCECDGGGGVGDVCGRDIVTRPGCDDSHSERDEHSVKNVVVIVTRAARLLSRRRAPAYLNGAVGRQPPTEREKSRGWLGGWDAAAAAALFSLPPGLSSSTGVT